MAAATATATPVGRKDFISDQDVRWCPGCGDYSILANVQKVMPELGLARENVVFVSGIGCSSRFPYYMNTYGFHTIHGRAPAFATGIKAARPELSVWVVTGDGDGLSIGGNHLLHVIRRNLDLQILLFNNRIYGLTKGQYSPTSREGSKSKSSPQGVIDHPIDPIAFALGAGATFVARTIDVDANHLQEMLHRAHAHRGTAFVEILQNCPVYNDGEWEEVENRKTRVDASLTLEDGAPLVWGPKGARRGIRIHDGVPSIVSLADGDDPVAQGVAVHREGHESPAYAFALASLARPSFPLPIGVFRAVQKTTYESLLDEQVTGAVAELGKGDLRKVLYGGDTWTVEA
jgi:2-oxoglutarate/2-oxoacid ferredoxin oxidoreductase subunit beta